MFVTWSCLLAVDWVQGQRRSGDGQQRQAFHSIHSRQSDQLRITIIHLQMGPVHHPSTIEAAIVLAEDHLSLPRRSMREEARLVAIPAGCPTPTVTPPTAKHTHTPTHLEHAPLWSINHTLPSGPQGPAYISDRLAPRGLLRRQDRCAGGVCMGIFMIILWWLWKFILMRKSKAGVSTRLMHPLILGTNWLGFANLVGETMRVWSRTSSKCELCAVLSGETGATSRRNRGGRGASTAGSSGPEDSSHGRFSI